MYRWFFVVLMLLCPVAGNAQTDADVLELAKLGLIEKMHAANGDQFRKLLTEQGHSEDDVDTILFETFEESATCIVNAARDLAVEQGLPVGIVLAGIGHKTRGKEDSRVLLELDTEALKAKTSECSQEMGRRLGLMVK